MKKWQENRNYRHIYDSDGNVTTNIITADRQDVAVSEEVFLAYSQADRRERYIEDEVEPGKLISLEQLLEDHVPLEQLGVECEESAEESLLEKERARERSDQKRLLKEALSYLEPDEAALIRALYFDRIPVRAYARHLGVQLRTVQYRRDKILAKLRQKFFL